MKASELPPKALPACWQSCGSFGPDGWTYKDTRRRLSVIQSIAPKNYYGDGRTWLHASIAHPDRMPTYRELAELKRLFVGEDRRAIMVLPPKAEHVNIHEHCLHLYCCLDDSLLPDFSLGTGSI